MKVVLMTPTRKKPHAAYVAALEASVPVLDAAGVNHSYTHRVGNPYISYTMSDMLFRAMQTDADTFMFLDDDVSWAPRDLLTVLEAEGDVVTGTYRFKNDKEEYMGAWSDTKGVPVVRAGDGALAAYAAPSGFLRINRTVVRKFMRGYPQLVYGEPEKPAVDLFNHGVILPNDGRWWGQDYAFCRRWVDLGEKMWMVPNLNIDHHDWDSSKVWAGNLHEWLLRQPGGSKAPKPNGKLWESDPYGLGVPKGALVAPTNAQLEMELTT